MKALPGGYRKLYDLSKGHRRGGFFIVTAN